MELLGGWRGLYTFEVRLLWLVLFYSAQTVARCVGVCLVRPLALALRGPNELVALGLCTFEVRWCII
jgi:hypothetical protein